jgi:hypothetical protein
VPVVVRNTPRTVFLHVWPDRPEVSDSRKTSDKTVAYDGTARLPMRGEVMIPSTVWAGP